MKAAIEEAMDKGEDEPERTKYWCAGCPNGLGGSLRGDFFAQGVCNERTPTLGGFGLRGPILGDLVCEVILLQGKVKTTPP